MLLHRSQRSSFSTISYLPKVLVELKAITELEKVHLAQALNYLEAFELEIGLLINFGSTRLTFRRLISEPKKKGRRREGIMVIPSSVSICGSDFLVL